jgi:hypothetical protein
MPEEWLLLIYKIPAEPTRYRASIWRKLKAAGAVYLQNGVAALPADAPSERAMRGMVEEIRTMQGTAHLVKSTAVGDGTDLLVIFNAARESEYQELLGRCRDFHAELEKERDIGNFTFAELEENEDDLEKLETWLGKIKVRDRFGVPLRTHAEQALAACRDDLERFSQSVYAAVDHGSASVKDENGEPREGLAE